LDSSLIATKGSKENDRRRYIGLLNNKTGLTIEQYAHGLWEEQGEGGRQMDSGELLDEVTDVLRNVNSVSGALHELQGGLEEEDAEGVVSTADARQAYPLTPLRERYVEEQTLSYDKGIADAEEELKSAQKTYSRKQREVYGRNSLFGDVKETGMFSGTSDFSAENQTRIMRPLKDRVRSAWEKLQALRNGRSAALENFESIARSQMEMDGDREQTNERQTKEDVPFIPNEEPLPFQIVQDEDLEGVNGRFNEELDQQIAGTLLG
jgi:hypothetical protein